MSIYTFLDKVKNRRNYSNLLLTLTWYINSGSLDLLKLITSYIYPEELCYTGELPKKLLIQITNKYPYDTGCLSNDNIYKCSIDQVVDVANRILNEQHLFNFPIIWDFPCHSNAKNPPSNFYQFWDIVNKLPIRSTCFLGDFSMNCLPYELGTKIISNVKEYTPISATLTKSQPLFDLIGPVKLLKEMSIEEKPSILIHRMGDTFTMNKDIAESDTTRIIMKDEMDRPLYIQIIYNNCNIHVLAGHFCELLNVTGNDEQKKNILSSVGIDEDIINHTLPKNLDKMVTCALQRQPSIGDMNDDQRRYITQIGLDRAVTSMNENNYSSLLPTKLSRQLTSM